VLSDPANYVIEVLVAFKKKTPPDDDLRIETYVGVYIYKSYNKVGFNSASVGVKNCLPQYLFISKWQSSIVSLLFSGTALNS
jgi:hypothetical protein